MERRGGELKWKEVRFTLNVIKIATLYSIENV